ncbi:hypothetical protein O7627_16040 [Solwaraspora sp. WMMD1047]|uniref:hypothetical protein n=1 Tax=Solwaraspora sp. WMMD1047 TaxID=3016102 RepID=UPI0024170666|nr:hypothetical protein [Solwaraspora sp. WMMD1047]MDG4830807.1 hypothetical protein [Solwaraspora sp. WMMD1047]
MSARVLGRAVGTFSVVVAAIGLLAYPVRRRGHPLAPTATCRVSAAARLAPAGAVQPGHARS